jgi:regulator of sigma D
MANRAEVLEKLKSAASEGNIREAYREFEELPIVDQLAISISPGVGDALALYEIGEFGARGAKNLAEKDFLGALGNYGLSGLSAISILPLFRLLRGAKAVKAVDPIADTPALPAKIETDEVVEEAVKDVPVPKVEEFKPLSLDEMTYPGTKVRNFGLTSKAAKFINTSKKLPNQGKAIGYINALEKAGVPKGELRLLNLIDEAGEIHPKLLSELEIRNPLGRITRQRLANYIKANQQDTLRKKMVSPADAEAKNRLIRVSPSQNLTNEKEITYHIPGIERGDDLGRHYNRKPEHEAHYAFDAAAEFELPNLDFQLFKEGDKILNVGRIQSDYSRELGKAASLNKSEQLKAFRRNPKVEELIDEFSSDHFQIMNEVARANSGLSTDKLITKFVKEVNKKLDADYSVEDFKKQDNFIKTVDDLRAVIKETADAYPITPYIDAKAIAVLKKSLNEYNQIVPKVNELSQKELKLQDEIKATGLDLNSPSLQDSLDELSEIRKERTDLIPSDVIDKFDGFTLNKLDLEDATGKDFSKSLDKSIDEIFYELEAIKPGSPAMRQKYGPGTPGERALKYFNELVNNNQMTFDIGNGVKILKKATRVNTENFKGVPIDPYAKGTKTEMYKFPLRARFVEAVERGFDGFSLDSAGKRLGDEAPGDVDNKFLKPLYDQDGPNEINKILKELGVDPKEYVERIDARANKPFSGTYVKIDDEIRKLVKEKGLDAFKDGGPVSIESMLAAL